MTDIANPTPAVLAEIASRMVTRNDGSVVYCDDHGQPILDFDREGVPYADAKGAAVWLARHRPDLWQSETAKAAPSDASPKAMTATAAMQAARSGRITDDEAVAIVNRYLAARPTTAAPSQVGNAAINYTTAMRAARQGDASSLDALMNRFTR